MRQAAETGLLTKWQKMWWPREQLCHSVKTEAQAASLHMDDAQGAFYLLSILIFTSLLAFSFEICLRYFKSWKEKLKLKFMSDKREMADHVNPIREEDYLDVKDFLTVIELSKSLKQL